jgi:hypothetical protein
MPSPATNLAQLMDFEGNFAIAGQQVMQAAGVTAYIDQQAEKIPPTNVSLGVDIGQAIDELTQIPAPDTWPADQAPPQEYFRYPVTLEYRIEVKLDANDADLPAVATLVGQFRGLVRAAMMRCVSPFTDTNLPFYKVSDIKPAGSTSGVMQTKNVYACVLRFTGTFEIRDSAWPAWVTS